MTYATISEVRAANAQLGHHWFDRDTLRFFHSRISTGVFGGRYFVSSEKGPGMARRYSVRIANDDGSIDTVGDFQQDATLAQAKARARYLATL